MIEKKNWFLLVGLSVVAAAGLGTLIYFQHEAIQVRRAEAETLRKSIDEARALLKETPELVKKVIIQRETDGVIKEILSDDQDINNLVRTLTAFCEEAGITISSIKKEKDAKRGKENFERVGYTLSFDADAFQLLAFLNKVESHSRFMSVNAFKLTAANRSDYENQEAPRHRIQVDLLVDRKLKAIFVESTVNPRTLQAVIEGAAKRGHQVAIGGNLFSDAMGAPGTYEGTYIGMIDHNATVIAHGLGGTAPERGMNGKLSLNK